MSRIVVVSNLFPPVVMGGAEIVAHRQATALAAEGHTVAVFAGGYAEGEREPGSLTLESGNDFPIYRLALTSLHPSENFYRPEEERRFLSVLATHQADLVHFHNVAGLGYNLIPAAKAFGARVIVTLHDHGGFCFKNTLLRNDGRLCTDSEDCAVCLPAMGAAEGEILPIRMRRDYVAWCLSQADQLLSPSAYLAEAFASTQVVSRPVQHLSNGIPTTSIAVETKPAIPPIRFTCFSYLGEHKGIATLLNAAEALAQDPALDGLWQLTIAGHGHLGDGLTQDIAAGRFGTGVQFAGRLPHAEALACLARTHVVVLASHWPENEPVTLLEAIASGTAQIATRIGGNRELVDEDQSGFLVEPGNTTDLADAMRRFIQYPDLVQRFGTHNAQRRVRFDEAHTLDRLKTLYETLPAAAPEADDIVVVCAGRAPSPAFSRKLQMMLGRFHLAEDMDRRVRFVWHAWAGSSVWRQAQLLWLWGETGTAELPLVTRALRAGIPVLAPQDSPLADATKAGSVVGVYASLLEAVGQIAALQDMPGNQPGLSCAGTSTARFLNAIAPRASFHLPVRALT
ncbi:glycosyltransferase family 4 protein [Methylobacterium sp. WL103]|uniref:glycosyltransferase n=1 Tax=Methylobacterium sp. WL103 TaxID=2603891 RepID=UPI0011C82C17|nr:glycosyltransferase [Methylobacterium sp. WL103]TXN08121.1 glycosyltransferase family 4 protein [Methylobacterium sp. WL103]